MSGCEMRRASSSAGGTWKEDIEITNFFPKNVATKIINPEGGSTDAECGLSTLPVYLSVTQPTNLSVSHVSRSISLQ